MTARASTAEELLAELSRVLWQQRNLIDLLEYRLDVQQLIMVSGRAERLGLAVGEVEAAMADIRKVEDRRGKIVSQAAISLGAPATATLQQIREIAPDPWGYVLADHQTQLLKLVSSTEALAARNRELSQKGVNDARAALGAMTGATPANTAPTYSRTGDRTGLPLPPSLVNSDA